MASSQVEFSSSSSPFGCVLRRDHNRRDANVTATHVARFRNNLKTLVMDRLNDCISITTPNQNLVPTRRIDHPHDSQQKTPPNPETDKETSKLGASSLVQIWEKRLNVSSNANANSKQVVEEQEQQQEQEQACCAEGEAGDFEDERYDAEEGFADWHSSRTSSSSPPSSTQSQISSDAGERERVRVVDIIRRLTLTASKPLHSSWVEDSNDHSNDSALFLKDQVDPKCLSHILCSPRIRGRQAFADLLLQIHRDRQKELDILVQRRPVSKFPQRGRIQSLLRLKILKRGMALEDEQQRRPKFVITPRQNHTSSTIMHLRERFSGLGARSSLGEMLNNNIDEDKSQSDTDTHATNTNDNDNDNDNAKDNQQDAVAIHSTSSIDNNAIPGDVNETIEEQGRVQELDPPTSEATWQDTPNLNPESQDSINGWEDSEAPEETYEGTSYDWFTDISRPRSYWEDRRQTWYQQMLDSNSANDEIRQLIKRKTVSNFLSSDFRERMDKLMVSRLERQAQQEEEYDEVNEDDDDNDDGAEEELWCFSEGHTQPKISDNEEEEDDERSLISAQYHEACDYLDRSASSPLQLASPSILSSWSYQDNEMMGEDSNRGKSTSSPQQPFPPQFSSNNQRSSHVSTTHHPSIEMELIYDLRGHMEQLYQEMSELRKSIKCCMDMQLMLQQQSMKHEVVAGIAGGGRKSNKEKSRKRKCCICYDMQIDSLLYRCGHMCSCMKCAKELQWRGGKCPICGAPIEDVVRASFTTRS